MPAAGGGFEARFFAGSSATSSSSMSQSARTWSVSRRALAPVSDGGITRGGAPVVERCCGTFVADFLTAGIDFVDRRGPGAMLLPFASTLIASMSRRSALSSPSIQDMSTSSVSFRGSCGGRWIAVLGRRGAGVARFCADVDCLPGGALGLRGGALGDFGGRVLVRFSAMLTQGHHIRLVRPRLPWHDAPGRGHMKRLTISARACTEILALLVKMAWADGRLEEREKESVRGAAAIFNLSKELRERLDKILEAPIPLDQILIESLSPRDRAFAFVAAAWLSGVDQNVDPKEQELLEEVATVLHIEGDRKVELEAIARDFLKEHVGSSSWAEHLGTLFKAIPRRLEGDDAMEIEFE